MKRCQTCGQSKPESEFDTYGQNLFKGRRPHCKDCRRAKKRAKRTTRRDSPGVVMGRVLELMPRPS